MKNNNNGIRKINMLAATAAIALCMMTGCAGMNDSTNTANTDINTASADTEVSAQKGSLSENQAATATASDELFTERDMQQTPDTSDAKQITVKDGETIDITEEGVYVISGTASDCTIKVNADKKAKVQLVLDGVSITNADFPAIYVMQADKVFVTSVGDNTLAVTGEFKADGDANTDAAIYSKDDITFNGTGTLTVDSAENNGISGKNDVKFTGGTYNITARNDAVEAKDGILVGGGTLNIKTEKDGLHAEDSDDSTKGYIRVTDGTVNVEAGNDGLQGTALLQIDGGTVNVTKSVEGLEAAQIIINGGTIDITATDDGINASSGAAGSQANFPTGTADGVSIEINGGEITINMSAGDTDGVDSNGSLTITGGTITVNTKGNAFDYENEPVFTGGKIIVNGEEQSEVPADMMGGFGKGGFGGGQRPDFDGEMPEGFEPPEGFDGKRPDFNGEKPEGFKGGRGSKKTDSGTADTDSTADT